MQKLFETNIYQSRDVLPDNVDADVVFTGRRSSSKSSFNWTRISKSTSTEHCSPIMCLEQELSQHPIQNCSSLHVVLNLKWWILQVQISNSLFSLSLQCMIRVISTVVSTAVTTWSQLAQKIKSITLKNASNIYSTFNSIKFNTDDPRKQILTL